ncbi:hypothetical protein ACFOWX_03020 [Sphingorhabdus arenilitoris]|uniref:Cardiolipin synthase N-terminal domain-containing protein n=1 Tax=Sphingorhabdus arenilitoris TaxID=1490041 RepID=A0ABV8RDH8_9SPHN
MIKFLSTAPTKMLAFLFVVFSGGLLILLQLSGIGKDIGLWIWAALSLIGISLIIAPKLKSLTGNTKSVVIILLLLPVMALASWLYMVYVFIPQGEAEMKAQLEAAQKNQ